MITLKNAMIVGLGAALATPVLAQKQSDKSDVKPASKPNVLFIIMDDMCDWQSYLGGNNQVLTPNLDRLSRRGVWFSNAYTAVPLSNPSRTAMLTGLQPWTTGIYNNEQQLYDSPAVNDCVMMPEHFRANGYTTLWSGKLFHNRPGFERLEGMWDDMEFRDGGYGPWVRNSTLPDNLKQTSDKWKDFEAWEGPDTDFPDVVNSQKMIDFLGEKHDKPFFAAMGFYRPHSPYTAPKRYFDLYDIDKIKTPAVLENDLDDLSQYAIDNFIPASQRESHAQWSTTGNYWKQLVRAYLASVSFADERVGMILDALEKSPYAKNTIVVLVGDNGFHHGEKQRFGKGTIWREACHVPFLVMLPTQQTGKVESPVSLIDIYPTLVSLCALPQVDSLAGSDLSQLLQNPGMKWDKPCVSTFLPGNFVVHSGDWNYLRYADGSKELYNVASDEDEFYNVAGKPENAAVMARLESFMPKKWQPAVKPRKDERKQRIAFPR